MTDTPAAAPKKGLPSQLQNLLNRMSGDMKLLGIVSIIAGALSCLSIVGAVIGVPVIFAGIRLRDAGEYFRNYAASAESNMLRSAIENQAKYFRIQKILLFVSIGLAFLSILFIVLMSGYLAMQMAG